jgi:hypothetical protein
MPSVKELALLFSVKKKQVKQCFNCTSATCTCAPQKKNQAPTIEYVAEPERRKGGSAADATGNK